MQNKFPNLTQSPNYDLSDLPDYYFHYAPGEDLAQKMNNVKAAANHYGMGDISIELCHDPNTAIPALRLRRADFVKWLQISQLLNMQLSNIPSIKFPEGEVSLKRKREDFAEVHQVEQEKYEGSSDEKGDIKACIHELLSQQREVPLEDDAAFDVSCYLSLDETIQPQVGSSSVSEKVEQLIKSESKSEPKSEQSSYACTPRFFKKSTLIRELKSLEVDSEQIKYGNYNFRVVDEPIKPSRPVSLRSRRQIDSQVDVDEEISVSSSLFKPVT